MLKVISYKCENIGLKDIQKYHFEDGYTFVRITYRFPKWGTKC